MEVVLIASLEEDFSMFPPFPAICNNGFAWLSYHCQTVNHRVHRWLCAVCTARTSHMILSDIPQFMISTILPSQVWYNLILVLSGRLFPSCCYYEANVGGSRRFSQIFDQSQHKFHFENEWLVVDILWRAWKILVLPDVKQYFITNTNMLSATFSYF